MRKNELIILTVLLQILFDCIADTGCLLFADHFEIISQVTTAAVWKIAVLRSLAESWQGGNRRPLYEMRIARAKRMESKRMTAKSIRMMLAAAFLAVFLPACATVGSIKDLRGEISDIWTTLRGHETRISKNEKNIIELSLANDTLFKTGSSKLSETAFVQLKKVTDIINQHPGVYIVVEGHTDSTGSDQINMPLSKARADSVAEVIKESGFPADHIQTVGYGSTRPIANNQTEEGRGLNRRVTIRISETKEFVE